MFKLIALTYTVYDNIHTALICFAWLGPPSVTYSIFFSVDPTHGGGGGEEVEADEEEGGKAKRRKDHHTITAISKLSQV